MVLGSCHPPQTLDAADQIGDLRVPPGNRLEKLKGDRASTYSIRVNDHRRICFHWTTAGPEEVEIVFSLNLHSRYELEVERDRLAGTLDQIEPLATA